MSQYLGDISAYALAVSQGYTGTEEEYAELMASYATVGQTAVTAAQTATTKASEAATSATTATNKATEATTAATTATNKAAEAQADADAAALDASQAMSAASTATTKATEATTAAATAVSAKDDAVSANTAAQSAKTAAQTAQTGAETAAASVQSSAAQIATNADDIAQLKSEFTALGHVIVDSKGTITLTLATAQAVTPNFNFRQNVPCKIIISFDSQLTGQIWIRLKDNNGDTFLDESLVAGQNGVSIVINPQTTYENGYIAIQGTGTVTYRITVTELIEEEEFSKKLEIRKISNWYNYSLSMGGDRGQLSANTARLININSVKNTLDISSEYVISVELLDNSYTYACAFFDGYMDDNGGNYSYALRQAGEGWSYKQTNTIVTATRKSFFVVMLKRTDSGNIDPADADNIISVKIVSPVSVEVDKQLQGASKWTGKKVAFVGDSITAGTGTTDGNIYYQLLNDAIGFSSVYADGIAGSCYSVTSNYGSSKAPASQRWQNIPTDRDLVAIFAGTNDWGHNTPLGTIADTTDVSFYGAISVVINGILGANPDARLVLFTPLHRYGYTSGDYPNDTQDNGQGHTLKDYVDAIKDIAEMYGVPVIDLFSIACLNPRISAIKTNYVPDGLHPNANGHALLAKRIAPLLNTM